MTSPRSSEEQWELLLVTIDLATGFELVLIACATEEVRGKLRARLRHECIRQARPFVEPEQGEDGLDWLTRLRGSAGEVDGPTPVLFYPVPIEEEREVFVLHRMNENRDNLRSSERGIRGVLILAGGPKLLKRAATEAPDLWSVRARSFELADLELPADLPPELAPPAEPRDEAPVIAGPCKYDVFLSCAYNDRQAIGVLRDALKLDGLQDIAVDEKMSPGNGVDFAAAAAGSRILLFGLSTDFITEVWPRAEGLFAEDPASVRKRTILLKLRPCVPPAELRSIRTLDWTTPARRAAAYPELLAFLNRGGAPERDPKLKETAVWAGGRVSSAQGRREASGPPAGLELVADKTVNYSATRVWGRRMALAGLVVAASFGVREAITLYEQMALVRRVFPLFGAGLLSISAKDRRMSIRKPLGIGSVDLRDAHGGGAPDVTIHSSEYRHYVMFNVSLTDTLGRSAQYQCTDIGASSSFILGDLSDSPGIDLAHIARLDFPIRLMDPPDVIAFLPPRVDRHRSSAALVCPLVKDTARDPPGAQSPAPQPTPSGSEVPAPEQK